jgi:hypothetical protein
VLGKDSEKAKFNLEFLKGSVHIFGEGSMENRMCSLAIISMSWLFNNMKRKVEDGHCHNTKHDHGDRNPRLCVKGSEFHKKLYDESLKSFEGVLQLAKEHAPKITSSQK